GFNLHLTKNYGYSQINTKCFITVPANKNKNISLICAVKKSGVIAFAIKEGSFDGASLCAFIQEKLIGNSYITTNDTLIMDNCRFYHRADVKSLLTNNRMNFMYLPAYSPQLNPIEEFFSALKSRYTSIKPLPKQKSEIISRLELILNENTGDLSGFYRNMRRWVETGLDSQFFE
ncbi:hypothetical protein CDIK_3619, partial [Cucumispora dikerogammari]